MLGNLGGSPECGEWPRGNLHKATGSIGCNTTLHWMLEHGPVGLTDQDHEQPAEASWLQALSARANEETTEQRVKIVVVRLDLLRRRRPAFHLWTVEGP